MADIYSVTDGNRIFAADIDQIATWLDNFMINVKAVPYGAKGDGTTDDSGAIQSAITAAQNAGGGVVFFPPTTAYKINTGLTVTADNVILMGGGPGSLIKTSSTFPASTPMIWYKGPGGSGNYRLGAGIANLRLLNTVGPTSAIGVQLDSTYFARIYRVDVNGVFANNIYLNGISGALGAYTSVRDCSIGAYPGGPSSGGIGILTNNHEFNVIDSCVINWFNTAGGYGIKLQNGSNVVSNCTFDECDTGIWVWFQSHNRIVQNQFARGVTQFIYLNGCKYSVIANNAFQSFAGSGSKSMLNIDNGSNASNLIMSNTCMGGTTWTNFVTESNGVPAANPNTYIGNDTAGLAITRLSGIFKNNTNYNPRGSQTAPSIPTSGTALTNPFGSDAMVYISGGTVTNVAIGGTNTGLTSGWFRIPANQTITLTYSVAPTWLWYIE